MNLGFCSLASSSSGNCYLIKSDSTNLLVDIGLSGVKIFENLDTLKIKPKDIDGVFITHEHIDHVRSIGPLVRKACEAKFYATQGTLEGMRDKNKEIPKERVEAVKRGDGFFVGDIEIGVFGVSHDAVEPVAYCFKKNDKKITIVTDTGIVTDEIKDAISESDILVIESNHEVNILLYGSYPYNVKHRILSDKGHLSNESAGKCICEFMRERREKNAPYIFLAHLSKENNTPNQAFITVKNILEEEDYYVGKHLRLEVLQQKEMGDLIVI